MTTAVLACLAFWLWLYALWIGADFIVSGGDWRPVARVAVVAVALFVEATART